MENFDDFENKIYRPALVLNYTFKDHVVFAWRTVSFGICVWFVASWDIFCEVLKLFWPTKLKKVSGQLALVTGMYILIASSGVYLLKTEQCRWCKWFGTCNSFQTSTRKM